jgi:hypothetical protein
VLLTGSVYFHLKVRVEIRIPTNSVTVNAVLVSQIDRLQCKGKHRPVTCPYQSQGRNEDIAPIHAVLAAGREWVISITPRLPYPRERHGTYCTVLSYHPRNRLAILSKFGVNVNKVVGMGWECNGAASERRGNAV